jgi:hypothetical protein
MRSDREEIPEGYTKEQADKAEMKEARTQKQERMARAGLLAPPPPGCQQYWPTEWNVCGLIRDKYNSLGGPLSFLLLPTSHELVNPDGFGRRSLFQNGPIYWSAASGAHPVVNHFMMKWGTVSWEGGFLKYPTSDEIVLQSSTDNIGRRQEFQGGYIYWHPTRSNLNIVGGAILGKYLATGAQNGPLGYPKSDEIVLPDGIGRMNSFEFGNLYWSPSTGAYPVYGTTNLLTGGILSKWATTGWEGGVYGYPTGDEQAVGSGRQQQFERGKIAWRTVESVAGNYTDTDWVGDDAELIDDNDPACAATQCGNDARVDVNGPALFSTPLPYYTDWDPGLGTQRMESAPEPSGKTVMCDDPNRLPDQYPCMSLTETHLFDSNPETSNDSSGPVEEPDSTVARSPVQSVEDFCVNNPAGKWKGYRGYACMTAGAHYAWGPLDTISLDVAFEIRPVWNSSNWKGRAIFEVANASGTYGDWTTVAGNMNCASGCSLTGEHNFAPLLMKDYAGGSTFIKEFTFSSSPPADGITTADSEWKFVFQNPDWGQMYFKVPYPDVRCDAKPGNRAAVGCVVPEAEPVLDIKGRGNVADHTQHIARAQASGLPGAPNGDPLQRTLNKGTIQANRDASCNTIRGRTSGQSCDEYPFASTLEGADKNPSSPRTFSNCGITSPPPIPDGSAPGPNGFSMCMIPASQNSRGGAIAGWFYAKNRILEGETFYINATQ